MADADAEDPGEGGSTDEYADGEPDAEAGTGADAETEREEEATGDVDGLVAEVAAHDVELAAEVDDLEERLAEAESELDDRQAEVDELEDRLKRERADFRNYKKRAKQREEQLKERATEDLVERLLDVRDNLVRALDQDDDADIRDGVEATLATFDRILEDENVDAIEPEPGDDVDPEVHEAVMRVEGDQPEGTIEEVYRPGYELAGKVLRPAQVTVSEDTADGDRDADEE